MYGEHLERGYALIERGSDPQNEMGRDGRRGTRGAEFKVWSGLREKRSRHRDTSRYKSDRNDAAVRSFGGSCGRLQEGTVVTAVII